MRRSPNKNMFSQTFNKRLSVVEQEFPNTPILLKNKTVCDLAKIASIGASNVLN